MSLAMDARPPNIGFVRQWLRTMFGLTPSSEIIRFDQATQRLETAASKIEVAVSKLDPLGELVEGLRAGPAERSSKRKCAVKKAPARAARKK